MRRDTLDCGSSATRTTTSAAGERPIVARAKQTHVKGEQDSCDLARGEPGGPAVAYGQAPGAAREEQLSGEWRVIVGWPSAPESPSAPAEPRTDLAYGLSALAPNVELSGLQEAGPLERRVGLVDAGASRER